MLPSHFAATSVQGASPSPGAPQAPSGAPLVEHAQERRQALDGEWYTMEEFKKFYQKPYGTLSAWRRCWDQAEREVVLPGASQPGLSHAAAPAAAPAAPAAEPVAAPAAPGVLQPGPLSPGDLQLALVPTGWQGSEFLHTILPQQQAALAASGQVFRVATHPREAMDLAYQLES